jgi:hypothetical protein
LLTPLHCAIQFPLPRSIAPPERRVETSDLATFPLGPPRVERDGEEVQIQIRKAMDTTASGDIQDAKTISASQHPALLKPEHK